MDCSTFRLFCIHTTVLFIFLSPPRFLLEIMVIIKISKKFLVSHKLWLIWKRMKQKKFKMADSKKSSFFKIANSQNFFMKIFQLGPWVSRIKWCEGHWCSSTYMAVRLSDKSSKTAKKYRKCIFWLFLSFCQTASPPYTLSYIDALCII